MIKTNDDPLVNALRRDIVDTLRVGADVTDANEKYSDHLPFREQGLPSVFVGSTSPRPGWGHTVADTLDKVRPESLPCRCGRRKSFYYNACERRLS